MTAFEIAKELGIKNKEEIQQVIDELINDKKLNFDPETKTFSYSLRNPLNLANGNTIDLISIKEPTGGDIAEITDITQPIAMSIGIVSKQNEIPRAIIERIGISDLTNIIQVINFFT